LATVEVEILYTQPQFGENGADLAPGHHHRQALRLACPHYPFDSIQGLFQDVLLVLRRPGHGLFNSEVGWEMVEMAFGQFARTRMGPVVRREEASNPVKVGLFGAAAGMSAAQLFQHAIV
jgi:hypothetical protein